MAEGAPLPSAAYAWRAGTVCPACQSMELARGRFDSTHPDTVTRRLGCETCGASWAAVYELRGYEGLRRPQEDAC